MGILNPTIGMMTWWFCLIFFWISVSIDGFLKFGWNSKSVLYDMRVEQPGICNIYICIYIKIICIYILLYIYICDKSNEQSSALLFMSEDEPYFRRTQKTTIPAKKFQKTHWAPATIQEFLKMTWIKNQYTMTLRGLIKTTEASLPVAIHGMPAVISWTLYPVQGFSAVHAWCQMSAPQQKWRLILVETSGEAEVETMWSWYMLMASLLCLFLGYPRELWS